MNWLKKAAWNDEDLKAVDNSLEKLHSIVETSEKQQIREKAILLIAQMQSMAGKTEDANLSLLPLTKEKASPLVHAMVTMRLAQNLAKSDSTKALEYIDSISERKWRDIYLWDYYIFTKAEILENSGKKNEAKLLYDRLANIDNSMFAARSKNKANEL